MIEMTRLTKTYGASRGVTDLTLHVPAGCCFGFIGPNGAGKSTTIRTLLGLIRPTSGSAAVLGLEDVERLSGGDDIVRQGRLPAAMALPDFLERVGKALGPNGIRYTDGERPIRRVAVGGGACGSFFRAAAAGGCDALVTADVKYDQFLDARALGLTLIDAGHFPTENVICPVLVRFLEERFCGLEVVRSAVHREVVRYFAVP